MAPSRESDLAASKQVSGNYMWCTSWTCTCSSSSRLLAWASCLLVLGAMSGHMLTTEAVRVDAADYAVLRELVTAWGNFGRSSTWVQTADCSTFSSVSCDTAGRVVYMDLSNNGLSGSIPSQLGLLKLMTLDLSNNQLSGSIPSQLGLITNLFELYLNNNQLNGSIPSQLGLLSRLRELDLNTNQLSGSIPCKLGLVSDLEVLFLHSNQLSGSIPSRLGLLSVLWGLNLANNQLSGSIPSELGLLSSVEILYLNNNQLSGSIPSELGLIPNLYELILSNNQLSGSVPSLHLLTYLATLDLSFNSLNGTLADKLSGLAWTRLTVNVANNAFCGEVPLAATLNIKNNFFSSNLSSYREITSRCPQNFSGNCIVPAGSGAVCAGPVARSTAECNQGVCVVNAWDASDVATVSTICNNWRFNSLRYSFTTSSPCPSAAPFSACGGNVEVTCNYRGRIDSLKVLRPILPRATEKGIPCIISNLVHLTSLVLPSAGLSSLPNSLSALVNLQVLDVSNNQITGSFPSISNLGQLSYIDLANNKFCGALPSMMLSSNPILNISNNYFSGELPNYFTGSTTECNTVYRGNCIRVGETPCSGQSQRAEILACRQFCNPPQLNCWIKNTVSPACGNPLPNNGRYCCRGNILGKTPVCRQQTGMCLYTHNCACPCNSRMEFTAWRKLTRTDFEGQVTRCMWTS